jgi:hypothetical protein
LQNGLPTLSMMEKIGERLLLVAEETWLMTKRRWPSNERSHLPVVLTAAGQGFSGLSGSEKCSTYVSGCCLLTYYK